jgi:imidazolonepropionase-like amidohydrolase
MRWLLAPAMILAILLAHPVRAQGDAAGTYVIHAGHLLADVTHAPIDNATIVVQAERVVRIADGFQTPVSLDLGPNTAVVDLRNRWVLPGLIDAHVHLTYETHPNEELEYTRKTAAHSALDGVVFARRTVEAGFTTVRDLDGNPDAVLPLRDAILAGKLAGPRILAAGYLMSISGGHGDINGYRTGLFASPDTVCDGADACRRAVRLQVKRGVDLIKIAATGGVMSNVGSGLGRQFTDDELVAIVEEAHVLGRRVAAHAHSAAGIKAALRAGVDSIEHGTFVDDEAIALFRKTGTAMVPTMLAGERALTLARGSDMLPPAVRAKALLVESAVETFVGRAHRGGVNLVFGTDTGVAVHGTNAREFLLLAKAGVPARVALEMATSRAAHLLGLDADIGSIAQGKSADIIAVDDDPRKKLETLLTMRFVMARGIVVLNRP